MEHITSDIVLDRIAKDGISAIDWLRNEVDVTTLLDTLERASTNQSRIVLCDVLGWRHERGAVEKLIELLEDESFKVRSSAADALAKIGDVQAGPKLLQRMELEPNIGVRRMLLAALGAVKYQKSIPLLIQYLQNPDPSQRGSSAWSLGNMHATEALSAIEHALRQEHSRYPRASMIAAIKKIRER